jgi:hypothetical protein
MLIKYLLSLSFLSVTTHAAPKSLQQWLNETLPHRGSSLKDELKCYTLPFGVIGFISHLLTYYTVVMLALGFSPWRWRQNTHWKFDFVLSSISLLWTLGATFHNDQM